MTPRPDPRLVAMVHLAENLAAKLPAARAHIRQQIDALGALHGTSYDGARTAERTVRTAILDDNGDPTGQYDNVPYTAVEDYALRRVHLAGRLDDIEADAKGIAMILARILRDCDQLIGIRHIETPRCDSTSRDGALEWADATCTEVPTRGPLCDRCSKREYRWRQRMNLPPRRDGVFAGDLDDRGVA